MVRLPSALFSSAHSPVFAVLTSGIPMEKLTSNPNRHVPGSSLLPLVNTIMFLHVSFYDQINGCWSSANIMELLHHGERTLVHKK